MGWSSVGLIPGWALNLSQMPIQVLREHVGVAAERLAVGRRSTEYFTQKVPNPLRMIIPLVLKNGVEKLVGPFVERRRGRFRH